MKKKIALAYSGGLDTTVIVPWLKENYDCEVIAVCGDVGQVCDWAGMKKKALSSGASKLIVADLKKEFVEEGIWALVKASAMYEGHYLLGTAAARPMIARSLAQIALKEGCTAVAHGATGKGNDQVRFEMGIKAYAPDLEVIAPWRIWDIASREEEVAYLDARGIPVPFKKDDSYSRDDNLWHVSHEGLDLEDPQNEPKLEGMLKMCVPPDKAPDKAEYVELSFEKGIPVALNGKKMDGVALIAKLNEIGGKHGVGLCDMVENRVVGMKSRGVYETPAGSIIMEAHQKLEQLCLDRKMMSFKSTVSQRFAELLYEGEWFSPLMDAINAFVDSTQATVSGTVKLKLWKGTMFGAGMNSPYSLYDHSLASFATGPLFDHHDATGFLSLYSLPVKARGLMQTRFKAMKSKSAKSGLGKAGSTKTVVAKPAKSAKAEPVKPAKAASAKAVKEAASKPVKDPARKPGRPKKAK